MRDDADEDAGPTEEELAALLADDFRPTEAELAALLAIAGQDRPPRERELWVPRSRVEHDHGPEVVAALLDARGLVVEWVHPDGPQLVLTAAGARWLGLVIDERIDLLGVSDVDDEGKPVRYDVVLKRDVWVEPPPYLAERRKTKRKWPYRLPRRQSMHPIPDPSLLADRRAGPLEQLIDLEAWSALLETPVAVDAASGRLVEKAGPGEEPRPVTILGADVRVGRAAARSAKGGRAG